MSTLIKSDLESWIPWIIAIIVIIIAFPWNKIREFFTPEPEKIIEYIPVPQHCENCERMAAYYHQQPPVQYIPQQQQPTQPVQYIPQQQQPTQPEPEPEPEPVENIVCVFTLENVLNAGDPGRCIEMCVHMGCKLAIVTSSDKAQPDNIPLNELGIVKPHYDDTDYYFNKNASTSNLEDLANTRITHLNEIMTKHSIKNPRRVILFDDNVININMAEENGFSTMLIGSRNPGIQEDDIKKAWELIKNLN